MDFLKISCHVFLIRRFTTAPASKRGYCPPWTCPPRWASVPGRTAATTSLNSTWLCPSSGPSFQPVAARPDTLCCSGWWWQTNSSETRLLAMFDGLVLAPPTRSIQPDLKALALGMQTLIVRTLGKSWFMLFVHFLYLIFLHSGSKGFADAYPSCLRVRDIVKESPVYRRTTFERRGSRFT